MDADYLIHSAEEVKRLTTLLRMTAHKRFPPDEAVDNMLDAVEAESSIFVSKVRKFSKENKG